MKVYLRVYQLPIVVNAFVTRYQNLFCKWNHCSLRFDSIVIHFYESYPLPRWTEFEVDNRLSLVKDEVYVGETNLSMKFIQSLTNKQKNMSSYDHIRRYLSALTLFHFPRKENDCVHRCSATLDFLFQTGLFYGTPDTFFNALKKRINANY